MFVLLHQPIYIYYSLHTHWFDEDRVRLNVDIKPLLIKINSNKSLLDARSQQEQKHYRAIEDVNFSLNDIDTIKNQ